MAEIFLPEHGCELISLTANMWKHTHPTDSKKTRKIVINL
ncbi:MAG: hypothetical protein FWB80_14525 [Defluviitaleaceae bacterium]|nr:hypothetical protein [Defluviitaleaceae bacterium]